MFKKFLITLRSKFYFIPSVYVGIFILLFFIFLYIDNRFNYELTVLIPFFLFRSSTVGSNVVIVVISSMLTILTVSFSVIMIVLTLYGNQLSPRTIQDFLEKRVTLRIIGYYIGVLIFSILSLFAMNLKLDNKNMIIPSISILFLTFGIIFFIYFMHLISKSIQTTLYIQNLVKQASELIDKKQNTIQEDPRISLGKLDEFSKITDNAAWEVNLERSGFIQYYDESKLYEIAESKKLVIFCERKVGEHIIEKDTLIKIYAPKDIQDMSYIIEDIKDMVKIGEQPNLVNDIYNKTKKLVEIAVRALSPGINDPNTAIFCIEKIGYLLSKIAKNSESKLYKNSDQDMKLILKGITFKHLLFDHFYQIKHYGIEDLMVFDAVIGALITISNNNTSSIKEQVFQFSEYLLSEINVGSYPDIERNYLFERLRQLSQAVNKKIDIN